MGRSLGACGSVRQFCYEWSWPSLFAESFMSQLDAVLKRIDAGLDASLERLFALLRIQSISTDPAYAKECRAAADHVAAELRGLGFETSVRPTGGHPVVIAANAARVSGNGANGKAPRVLFYGHYDVQPVDP